jgi:hypothetical protein
MEYTYENMTLPELEGCLEKARDEIESAEDELSIVLERSNSGQHMSSKYVQKKGALITEEIETLRDTVKRIEAEIARRK